MVVPFYIFFIKIPIFSFTQAVIDCDSADDNMFNMSEMTHEEFSSTYTIVIGY